MQLDESFAATLAAIALPGVHRAYPNKIAHAMTGDDDACPPHVLTPMFYGCFDWHSAVHSHWTLARLARLFPDAPWAAQVRAALARSFCEDNLAGEKRYAQERPSFEMPYGVAWLWCLTAELRGPDATLLTPLLELRRAHFCAWLDRLPGPIRTGEHNQTAFAMGMISDAATALGDHVVVAQLQRRARQFYAADIEAPVRYEPSAFDFLSPVLAEADLMRRVFGREEFARWFASFLPDGFRHAAVTVADRSDGKLAHYDGLNFSRAWMLRAIATALPDGHPGRDDLLASANAHRAAGLTGLTSPHYAGQHWLPSFALLATPDHQEAEQR